MGLDDLRKKIDVIDQQLIQLIEERMVIAKEIGHTKQNDRKAVFSAEREAEIYRNIIQSYQGVMSQNSLIAIFREIMSASINLQDQLIVSYLGPEATFTHQAAIHKFGNSVQYEAKQNIQDVFISVRGHQSQYGVVPVENSFEGSVTHTLDLFLESNCSICSEIFLPIHHHLLSNSDMNQIKKIYSKAEVFPQCRTWLRENLPKAELIESSSTAQAAQIVLNESGSAAISSQIAAQIYQIPVLASQIEDSSENTTRFLVIGHDVSKPTGKDKTSIVFFVQDKIGSLNHALETFQELDINLKRIESRPSKKKKWEYCFYIDFEGHIEDEKIKLALEKLQSVTMFIKILGSYPINDWS